MTQPWISIQSSLRSVYELHVVVPGPGDVDQSLEDDGQGNLHADCEEGEEREKCIFRSCFLFSHDDTLHIKTHRDDEEAWRESEGCYGQEEEDGPWCARGNCKCKGK